MSSEKDKDDINIVSGEGGDRGAQHLRRGHQRGRWVVVKTFKKSTAERVASECSQLRYTSDILEYLFKSTAERVPSECS